MGVNCSTCCGNENELQEQLKSDVFQQNKTASRISGNESHNGQDTQKELVTNEDLGDQIGKLIRLQAIVKAYLQKKKYRLQRTYNDGTTKYFKAHESEETLLEKFNFNAPTTIREHVYKTGAVYQGMWKGGLRHGQGKMTWPDGACYEGDWSFNHACGKGKFFHSDGDIYDG